jgi:hypothetical protein
MFFASSSPLSDRRPHWLCFPVDAQAWWQENGQRSPRSPTLFHVIARSASSLARLSNRWIDAADNDDHHFVTYAVNSGGLPQLQIWEMALRK